MTDVAGTTRFLLSERNNPHSSVRSNGRRGWYYPSRTGGLGAIRTIGVHTTEGGRALNTARWQASTAPAPSSYHVIAEAEGLVRTLADGATAFHIAGHNTPSLGLSFAMRAADWGKDPSRDRRALEHAARQARAWCRAYNIPVRWLTKAQADRGERGFVRHATMDPSRRSDPGARFPADTFFDLIRDDLEDDMPSPKDWDDRDVDRMMAIIARTMIVGTDKHLSWHLRRIETLSALTAGKIDELGPLSDEQVDELADAIAEAVQGEDADRLIDRLSQRLAR